MVGRPGGGLSWLVTDVPLARALGPSVQAFDMTKASGRLTSDGETYRFESQTAIRDFAFDPAALGDRALRINNANLDCTGILTSDFTQLNINGCRLEAVQGDLTSKKGVIDLVAAPKLALNLQGWLSGPFLSGLVPEFTPKWPARINVSGHLMVPFTGAVWPNMEWELAANGKDFTYEELKFKDLEARVTKSVGRLNFNISGKRGGGTLVTAGSLELGDKDVTTAEITATRVPIHRKLGSSYSLEATVSGSTKVTMDAAGERGFLDNQLTGVKLRRGRKVAANLESAKLRGDLKRTRQGGLWAKDLALVGPQLNLRIHDSHLPLEGSVKGELKLNADFTGNGDWLALATALGGAAQVRPAGDSQMSIRLQGKSGRTLESATGTGTLKVARLSLWDHPFSNADVAFELHPNEINITRGLVKYKSGKVALEGNFLFPHARGDQKEHLVLQLDQVPAAHTQALTDFKGGGPAKLINATTLNGHISLDGSGNGQRAVTTDIKTGPIARRLRRGEENLATAELPALHFQTKLLSRTPLQRWTTTTFDIGGNGISIQLTDGQFLWGKAAHRLAGALALEMSPEFLEGMALGLIPPEIKPTGNIAASGQAQLRVPSEGAMGMEDLEFDGTLKNDKLIINADAISALRLALRLAGGRLDVTEGEAALLGGRVWLPTPSAIDLIGPAHEFNLHIAAKDLQLRTYGGRQVSLGHFLGLLIPVFLFTSDSHKPVGIKGVLQTELQLGGTYQNGAGWSRTVNGKGSFRIDDGAVEGSSLLSGIIAKSLLMPTNVVHNSVAALFSRDGEVGRALTDLGDRAFTFQTIGSPITVRNGEILLKKDLTVSSPEMTLTINGHSNLEGELDYDVGTDLIKRVRLGEITDLPNKIPIIGKAISFLNPFTYLDGIELRGRVTGNLLKTRADGQSDVHVETSVVDMKRS